MLFRIKNPLPVLALADLLSPSATTQRNEIDLSKPLALDTCGAVNDQLERWETGVFSLEKVTLPGDADRAMDSLEEALAEQLADCAGRLASDPTFQATRKQAPFEAIQRELAPIENRMNALSRAQDVAGLIALFHAA